MEGKRDCPELLMVGEERQERVKDEVPIVPVYRIFSSEECGRFYTGDHP